MTNLQIASMSFAKLAKALALASAAFLGAHYQDCACPNFETVGDMLVGGTWSWWPGGGTPGTCTSECSMIIGCKWSGILTWTRPASAGGLLPVLHFEDSGEDDGDSIEVAGDIYTGIVTIEIEKTIACGARPWVASAWLAGFPGVADEMYFECDPCQETQ